MTSDPAQDFFDEPQPPARPTRGRMARAWSGLLAPLARLRAMPIAEPFRDSDFEPTEWTLSMPAFEESKGH